MPAGSFFILFRQKTPPDLSYGRKPNNSGGDECRLAVAKRMFVWYYIPISCSLKTEDKGL